MKPPPEPYVTKLTPVPEWQRRAYERMTVGAPWMARLMARVVARRPPRSSLRRSAFRAMAEANAREFENAGISVQLASFHPDVMVHTEPKMHVLGVDEIYTGHDGVRQFVLEWREGWGDMQFRFEEVHDAGELVLVPFSIRATARVSGFVAGEGGAMIARLARDGRIAEQWWFFDPGAAKARFDALRSQRIASRVRRE